MLAGQPVQAARHLGTAARARESTGAPLPEAERDDVERITARILTALHAEEFALEFSTGVGGDPDAGHVCGRTGSVERAEEPDTVTLSGRHFGSARERLSLSFDGSG
ncbi:hypothetical protein Q5762_10800 [Streptomyces sp. P9(2023)]|uniref:hypothetical protein n=1 Tax=Streptomyces sp. P9(2023) TaxID=3064394 RepID=UPI0028F3F6E1|nr:hypothetical protein [Streptomyces sp. P9(2023)]MDT9688840.1 hypothetical protein [Streptomyces sp. P9(2023)]